MWKGIRLPQKALVGIESTGYALGCAERLRELAHELVVGDAAQSRNQPPERILRRAAARHAEPQRVSDVPQRRQRSDSKERHNTCA